MASNPRSLNIAQVALYVILIIPSTYSLFRHGKHGILGWIYLMIFCTIRIVAGALELSENSKSSSSTAALIVENIGLSPLVLAALGILHEARDARGSITNARLEWTLVLQYHVAVSTALALVAVNVALLTGKNPSSTDWSLLRAGFAVLIVCWAMLVGWTLWSFKTLRYVGQRSADGTKLLYSVLFVLPLILLRAIYGLISLLDGFTSTFASNLAANVCMSVVPQLLAMVIFALAGILTRNMQAAQSAVREEQPASAKIAGSV